MSFRKREREYEAAERKYRTGLIRIIRQAFLIQPPRTAAGLRSINITKELKRPTIKNKINTITAALFDTGTKHATEIIEELIPKRLSAAYQAAATIPYNQQLINNLTDHTITNMAYIAEDVKKDLIISLEEGYAEGEGIPALTKRVQKTWDMNKVRAVRFARTFTNEVYNQAHFARYQDSTVVNAIQFSAHLDSRTSDQCRMLNKTIWKLNDPAIQRPPLHYNCRSRLLPYFEKVPGKRDFSKSYDGVEYSKTDIAKVQKKIEVFRSKYWKVPLKEMPKITVSVPTSKLISTRKVNKTLAVEEPKIRNDTIESGITIDKNTGNVLLKKSGTTNYIEFTEDEYQIMKGNIFTHNHPSGTSLSRDDVRTMCHLNIPEMRATSKEYTYILKIDNPTSETWDDIISYAYKSTNSIQCKQWGRMITEGEMTVEYANANHQHTIWKNIFKDFKGMTYTWVKN